MPALLTRKTIIYITLAILLPLLVLGIAGRVLDKHFNTSPWILLIAIFLALHATLILVILKVKDILRA